MKTVDSTNIVIQVHDVCIGENIAFLRKQRKIKQVDMLNQLQLKGIDISIYSYNRIEKGTQNPTVSTLLALCDILDCDMNTLFKYNKKKS